MADTIRNVSRFEANLLTILHFLLGQPTSSDALRMMGEKMPRPACLSPSCVHLIKDSLSKGCVLFLIRQGGWRVERILKKGEIATGRGWERTPLNERFLSFGPNVIEFLMWLTSEQPKRSDVPLQIISTEPTAAEELFFTMVLSTVENESDTQWNPKCFDAMSHYFNFYLERFNVNE